MLIEIREKVQGVFASIILVLISVLFGLWGIQNYLGEGKEAPLISVGDRDFYQRDVSQAYQQLAQSLAGMAFDEELVKNQAIQKLIRDEVLLQYAVDRQLLTSDEAARRFIHTLEYFQKDGKFDKAQYQALLAAQGMSSDGFVARIKNALIMEQIQRGIVESGFATQAEIDAFFKIQNQTRDIQYVSIGLATAVERPTEDEILAYYQQYQDSFKTEEQVSVDYVELSLDRLAKDIVVEEEQLKAFYEEQKAQFTTPERRKISHILFASGKEGVDREKALTRAHEARQRLKDTDFAKLATELSDDKLTAKQGGDLGLFTVGVMEKAFEDAVGKLKQGEVSEPVPSAFGYHLIKVTELVPGQVKPYEAVKAELTKAYQKAQAESKFAELAQKLGEVSYENPDSLAAATKLLGVSTTTTALFTRKTGAGIAANDKVRAVAFSDDVLKGSNSEPIEMGEGTVIVLRVNSHLPASTKELKDVRNEVIAALQKDRAQQKTDELAAQIKAAVSAGKPLAEAAADHKLPVKKIQGLSRASLELAPEIVQAIFRAAKPKADSPSLIVIDNPAGGKLVASVVNVTEGRVADAEKAKLDVIRRNIALAFGKAQFEAVLNQLQANADITVRQANQ
ncbi:MAG: SurA N-terminal domain-containing protein [Methylomonas sp.]|nr:SurA N-terminal domain-containing protein [Methylomonas sp.]PPD21523.1 MAG: peptidylprolyl isomerase [Methylomonas sp.]PPD26290.1 MAG: peptidylprolyl isomerase [Methylomonas sp.]PPD38007.1 MAG: peptidylprolyl isomerase [Methylomonas sp.]PPD38442.1 MAG: peptidylprolyl isomerase [Methylomonas sp.]